MNRPTRRFYKSVEVSRASQASETSQWILLLDGKPLLTPSKNYFLLPTLPIAESVCKEWESQCDDIAPLTMPLTRLLNTAYDGTATDMQSVKEEIVRYGSCDMLCYRSSSAIELHNRQKELWDPWIDYARTKLGCVLEVGDGVIHIDQDSRSMASLNAHIGMITNPLLLSALYVVTSLTGSAILSLAIFHGDLSCDDAWHLCHLDEDYNREHWGEDSESVARRHHLYNDMRCACFVLSELGSHP